VREELPVGCNSRCGPARGDRPGKMYGLRPLRGELPAEVYYGRKIKMRNSMLWEGTSAAWNFCFSVISC